MIRKVYLALSVVSILGIVLAILPLVTMRTSDLPASCRSTLSVQVSGNCRQDIKTKTASLDPNRACYDNFEYGSCEDLAENIVFGKQLLLASIAGLVVFGLLAKKQSTQNHKK